MSKSKITSNKSQKNFTHISGISKSDKSKRAKYLSKRINELLDSLSEWLTGTENYSFKRININIDGEKLPATEIYSGKKFIVSIKPAGLYAFGFNCRIDITSDKTTNILFDASRENAESDWQLVSSDPGKKPKKLTKMVFRNLIKKLK